MQKMPVKSGFLSDGFVKTLALYEFEMIDIPE
jgi:hypothetical protein